MRIAVYEETGKLIGQRVLPLDGLQAGFRHISLRSDGHFPLSLPTLFCHIVLKTYVPDGLGDFVDALNNPKEFLLTQQEKRLKQLQEKLGVDERDIVLVPNEKRPNKPGSSGSMHGGSSGADAGNAAAAAGGAGAGAGLGASASTKRLLNNNETTKKDELLIERITRETLESMKGFQKLLKKHAKEKENLKKKHNKERSIMQKQHCAIIDKLNATNVKPVCGAASNYNSNTHSNSTSALVKNGNTNSNSDSNNNNNNNNANSTASFPIQSNNKDNNSALSHPLSNDDNENAFKSKVQLHISHLSQTFSFNQFLS